MRLFLGIDGGQSSTVAFIGSEDGRVLGQGKGGPCNHVTGPEAEARFTAAITECLSQAAAASGLAWSTLSFEAACCGMSGGPHDKRDVLNRLIPAARLIVDTDSSIALSGALEGRPGVVVIAGTGSIAFGRNEAGVSMRAGGWGHLFGDEGGAFDIARQALRAALAYEEGWSENTALLPALLNATGARDANELLHSFYGPAWPRSRVAALAVLVDQVALDGDSPARALLRQAGQDLAALARAILTNRFSGQSLVPVAYTGGAFRSAIVLQEFTRVLESDCSCRCLAPLLPPAGGALLEALRIAGLTTQLSHVPPVK